MVMVQSAFSVWIVCTSSSPSYASAAPSASDVPNSSLSRASERKPVSKISSMVHPRALNRCFGNMSACRWKKTISWSNRPNQDYWHVLKTLHWTFHVGTDKKLFETTLAPDSVIPTPEGLPNANHNTLLTTPMILYDSGGREKKLNFSFSWPFNELLK